ncbi:MAG: hypothetical protein R3F59_18965 [Myxococcota bacterium]
MDELDDWREAWHAQPVRDPTAWLAKARRRARLDDVRAVVSLLIGVTGYAALAVAPAPTPLRALGAAGLTLVLGLSAYALWLHRGALRAAGASTEAYAAWIAARARARLRYYAVFRVVSAVWLVGVALPVLVWVEVAEVFEHYGDFLSGVAIGATPLVVAGFWLLRREQRRAEDELREAEALLAP